MSPAFVEARKHGKLAQSFVKGMFESWELEVVETPDGYFPGYDLNVFNRKNGTNFKAEVKYDMKSHLTNRLYLEINSLSKSTASLLCICVNIPIDTVMIMPLKSALEFAKSHANINAGEFNDRGCLVDKSVFIQTLNPQILTATT
jgi:hypothetical protein